MISLSSRRCPQPQWGRRCLQLVAPFAVAAVVTGCQLPQDASGGTGTGGDEVTSIGFSRSGTVEKHRAFCGRAGTDEYRVQVPASVADTIREGDPCPSGAREPLARDQYPEMYEALTETLPYGGGNAYTCGAWETIDKAEARRLANECPPLKWGDVDG